MAHNLRTGSLASTVADPPYRVCAAAVQKAANNAIPYSKGQT